MRFVGRRKIWYLISLLVIIPGMVSFLLNGLNLGIDFTGGNLMQIKFEQDVTIENVRTVVSNYVKETPKIQESGENTYLIRTVSLTEEENTAILKELTSQYGQNEVLRNEHVGAVIGKELTLKAIYALLIASVLMVIYITIRFEVRFAIAAIIAILHDVFVTIGIFSILQIEVDSAFVAAILTIVGYSINDTIVIFDRIRENLKNSKKEEIETLVDRSISQTLARSINTVLTSVFTLIALLVLGGESTKVFALALLVGIVSGAYSSIFTASPVWFDLKNMAGKKQVA